MFSSGCHPFWRNDRRKPILQLLSGVILLGAMRDGVTHQFAASQTQTFGVSEFDEMNRRKQITREDGTRWAYGYNAKGEVTSALREKTASPNTPVPGWNHGYTFDEIGNRLTATTNGRESSYTPNSLNQYNSRTIPRAFDVIGKANAAASVTVNGNASTRLDEFFYKELTTGSGTIHVPYSVTATDSNGTTTRNGAKFLAATPENFTYDFDGNLISDGRFTCTWDAENRLVSMETHPSIPLAARRKLAFAYDSMNRRIRKTVWHGTSGGGWQLRHQFDFIHELNGWNILAERSGGSSNSFIRTYTWGTDLSNTLSGAGGVGGLLFATLHPSGKTFAYGHDLNGNITLLIDTATSQAAATYDYGPFGEPLRQSGEYALLNPYRFSTKYTDDETGWLDYGRRYYIPALGRWASKDPIEEKGGVNLYGFVGNDGVNRIDLLGLRPPDVQLKNCTIAVYGGHGLAIPPENDGVMDPNSLNGSEVPINIQCPPCSAATVIACNANKICNVNNVIPGAPLTVGSPLELDPVEPENSFCPQFARAVEAAKEHAKTICNKKPACCKKVKVQAELLGKAKGMCKSTVGKSGYKGWIYDCDSQTLVEGD